MNNNNKKSILIFSNYYKPGIYGGGPIRSLEGMIGALNSHLDFKIITSSHDAFRKKNYENIIINSWNNIDKSKVFYSEDKKFNFKLIKNLIIEDDVDILYFNSFFNFKFTFVPLMIIKFIKNRYTIIISPSGELNKNSLNIKKIKKTIYIFLFKFFFKNIVWHSSNSLEKKYIKKYFPKDKIFTVPKLNILKPIKQKKVKKSINELKIVFISRLTIIKNLEYALDILSKINGAISFKIYGPIESQSYFNKINSKIKKLQNKIDITYEGELNNSNVHEILKKNHIFLLPTQNENYGHIILESIYNLCPVIISKNTPWQNLEEKNLGFDLELKNKDNFIKKISFFLNMNQSDYQKYINKMSDSVIDHYNINKSIYKKYIDMFK